MMHQHRSGPEISALVFSALVVLGSTASAQETRPSWAYPVNPPLPDFDNTVELGVPDSNLTFTEAEIEANFAPPDWYPDEHPPMPAIVAFGSEPSVMACMKCHLSNGAGHPESAALNGLSVDYVLQQFEDFRNGNRKGARATSMFPIAQAVTQEDLIAAAEYYRDLPPLPDGWRQVVETETVPTTRLGIGAMRFATEDGATEPLGERIIVLPQDPERAERRDPHSGFISYVPVGSLARGETLVTTGGGKTLPCATCHGQDLLGNENRPELQAFGQVPPIAGRSPIYTFRQLNDFRIGSRTGPHAALMLGVVTNLDQSDMIAIAAYLATATP